MSGISDYIEQIRSATYGEEVRGSIVSALEQCYADATGNPESVAALTEMVNNLVVQGYVTSAELEEAIASVQTDGIQKPSRVTITAPNIINNPTGVTGAILSVAEGFSAGDSVTISADILSASEVTEACFYVMVYDDTFDVGSRLYGETLSGATTSEFSRLNWTIKIDERYTTAEAQLLISSLRTLRLSEVLYVLHTRLITQTLIIQQEMGLQSRILIEQYRLTFQMHRQA